MNKVYRHRSLLPDELLGHIHVDGKVYETRSGPDKYVGRVELETGKIFESHLGPDKHIGRVDLRNGKVFLTRIGPDEYLGRVHEDGKLYAHKELAPDEYLGKVTDMSSLAHGGGAFLLLVIPAYEEQAEKAQDDEPNPGEAEAGVAPA